MFPRGVPICLSCKYCLFYYIVYIRVFPKGRLLVCYARFLICVYICIREDEASHTQQTSRHPSGNVYTQANKTRLTQQTSRHPSGKTCIYTQSKQELHNKQVGTPRGKYTCIHKHETTRTQQKSRHPSEKTCIYKGKCSKTHTTNKYTPLGGIKSVHKEITQDLHNKYTISGANIYMYRHR